MPELVQPLFDGPVDIVGDIHGEIGALDALLERLGYTRNGRHRSGNATPGRQKIHRVVAHASTV